MIKGLNFVQREDNARGDSQTFFVFGDKLNVWSSRDVIAGSSTGEPPVVIMGKSL